MHRTKPLAHSGRCVERAAAAARLPADRRRLRASAATRRSTARSGTAPSGWCTTCCSRCCCSARSSGARCSSAQTAEPRASPASARRAAASCWPRAARAARRRPALHASGAQIGVPLQLVHRAGAGRAARRRPRPGLDGADHRAVRAARATSPRSGRWRATAGSRYGRELLRNPLIVSTWPGWSPTWPACASRAGGDHACSASASAALPFGLMAVGAGLRFGGLNASPGLAAALLGDPPCGAAAGRDRPGARCSRCRWPTRHRRRCSPPCRPPRAPTCWRRAWAAMAATSPGW